MKLLPDLGTYLIENQFNQPFIIRVFDDLLLGQDRVLGWTINGSTHQFQVSPINNGRVPQIDQPYLFTIYLETGSLTRAEKILARLKTEGLPVIPRQERKYLVPSGKESVVPLQYLKSLTSIE